MADEDNRLKSNRTWIKWTKLEDGLSLEYHNNWYKKPGDEEDLKRRIRLIMACNDRAKQKKIPEGTEPKRARVKYADAIDRVKHIKKWGEWVGLEDGTNKTLKYHGRTYSKDIPNDEEKLMTAMVNQLNSRKRAKERKELTKDAAELVKNAASVLVNIRGKGGNERNIEGIMGNDAEDDDNRKPADEPMGEDDGGKEGGKETGTNPELENVYLAPPDEESALHISLNETVKNNVVIEEGSAETVADGGGGQ